MAWLDDQQWVAAADDAALLWVVASGDAVQSAGWMPAGWYNDLAGGLSTGMIVNKIGRKCGWSVFVVVVRLMKVWWDAAEQWMQWCCAINYGFMYQQIEMEQCWTTFPVALYLAVLHHFIHAGWEEVKWKCSSRSTMWEKIQSKIDGNIPISWNKNR